MPVFVVPQQNMGPVKYAGDENEHLPLKMLPPYSKSSVAKNDHQ